MERSFGSNDLAASASFDQRVEYMNNFPDSNLRSMDFWYSDLYYGRVNTKGDAIYPSEAHLKQIPGSSAFVLNFVADAYARFSNSMKFQFDTGNMKVPREGNIFKSIFSPARGWESLNVSYGRFIDGFYNGSLFPYLMSNAVSPHILNFDDFVEAFTRLIERTSLLVPFTKTGYLMSKFASPLMSALAVELVGSTPHDDDNAKISSFINHLDFEVYRREAGRHGFIIDKNAPWRLIALPGYPQFQEFLEPYNLTFDTLFQKYYYSSHFLDIPNLKSYLFQYYQAFIERSPEVRVPELRQIKNKEYALTKLIPRATMTGDQFSERYDNTFWIRLYVYLRAQETNQDWDQYKFDHVVKEATDFFVYATQEPTISNEEAAFKFINKEVKRTQIEPIWKHRRGTFRFKRKQRYREENK